MLVGKRAYGLQNFLFGEVSCRQSLFLRFRPVVAKFHIVNRLEMRLFPQIIQSVVEVDAHQPRLETAEVVVLLRLLDGFEESFVCEVLRHGAVAHIAVAHTDHLADVLLVGSCPKLLCLHIVF